DQQRPMSISGKTTWQHLEIFIKILKLPSNPKPYIESIIIKNEVIINLWDNESTSKINKIESLLATEMVERSPKVKGIPCKEFKLIDHIINGSTCQVQKAMWNIEDNKIYITLKFIEEKLDETKHQEIIGEQLKVYYTVNAKDNHEDVIKFYGSCNRWIRDNSRVYRES
ncbi:17695_t:CDS:2, partial [Acaulospora morrowiae]